MLDRAVVTLSQTISAADIGKLIFTPALNGNGTNYSSFTFQVVDDGGVANGGQDTDQSPNTITFNVTAVNDAPVDGDEVVSVTEDIVLSVPVATGLLANSTDVDGNTLTIINYSIAGIPGTQTIGSNVVATTPAGSPREQIVVLRGDLVNICN